MKISGPLISLFIICFLFSCAPKKPEIPMTEVPAGPLVRSLEERRQAFSTLKAVAGVTVSRKDRKRAFENVGILLKGQEQFRIEAYGPFGQTLLTFLWNGNELLLDLEGRRRVLQPESFGLERLLGADLNPAELGAILSGNVTGNIKDSEARLRCGQGGRCILELRKEETLVRVYQNTWESNEFAIPFFQVYESGKLSYQVKFESYEEVSGYELPKRITVENPGRRISLVVEYSEAEVNEPLDKRAFIFSGPEAN